MFSPHPGTTATGLTATAGAGSMLQDTELIACVVENRGRTVAIATMTPSHTHILHTYIVQDSQSYGGASASTLMGATPPTSLTHLTPTLTHLPTHTHVETLDLLMELRPRKVLLHDGSRKRPLATKIQSLVRTALAPAAASVSRGAGTQPRAAAAAAAAVTPSACVFVSRNYFDQDKGAELLRRLSVDAIDAEMLDSYVRVPEGCVWPGRGLLKVPRR